MSENTACQVTRHALGESEADVGAEGDGGSIALFRPVDLTGLSAALKGDSEQSWEE